MMRTISDSVSNDLRLPSAGKGEDAFAFLDLLVIIAMLGIVAAIVFPALFRGKMMIQRGACVNDLHQIQIGWLMYNNENNGNFPCNVTGLKCTNLNWVANYEDYAENPTDTNSAIMVNPRYSLLAPYVRNPAVYRCPADQSESGGLTGLPRVRSYSMSIAVGPSTNGTVTGQGVSLGLGPSGGTVNQPGGWTVYLSQSMEVGAIRPSDLIVLVDEHPDGINDGTFAFSMPLSPTLTEWVDVPTPLHGNAGSFSFADGHAEIHHWLRPSVIPPVTYHHQGPFSSPISTPDDPDILWIASHMTVPYPP